MFGKVYAKFSINKTFRIIGNALKEVFQKENYFITFEINVI